MRSSSEGITTPTTVAILVAIVLAASIGYLYENSGALGSQESAQHTSSTQLTELGAFSAREIHVGCCPGYVAFDQKNGLVYVTVQPANAVYAVNPVTGAIVANISVGGYPRDVVVNPTNGMVYVVNQGSDSVSVIDGTTNKVVATIPVGRSPVEIAVNPTTSLLYVPDESSHELSVIDGAKNAVVVRVDLGCNGPCGKNTSTVVPNSVDVNPSTDMVYVTSNGVNSLTVVNGSTNSVVGSVPVGTYPNGVAVDPASGSVFVSNLLNNTVSIVSASKMSVVETLKVGSQPGDVAYDPVLGDVFVVNKGNDTVSVIGTQTNSLIGSARVGADYSSASGVGPAGGLGVDAKSGDVYVAVPGTGNVTVISKCLTSVCPEVSGATPPCGTYGVIWSYPNSFVPPGSTVSSRITTCTKGTGSWSFTNQLSKVTVASGSFSCPCADVVLFNYIAGVAPITNGTYLFQDNFNGGGFEETFVVGSTIA